MRRISRGRPKSVRIADEIEIQMSLTREDIYSNSVLVPPSSTFSLILLHNTFFFFSTGETHAAAAAAVAASRGPKLYTFQPFYFIVTYYICYIYLKVFIDYI